MATTTPLSPPPVHGMPWLVGLGPGPARVAVVEALAVDGHVPFWAVVVFRSAEKGGFPRLQPMHAMGVVPVAGVVCIVRLVTHFIPHSYALCLGGGMGVHWAYLSSGWWD